jgi:putative spermidine/putrescine transport system substrate-binding protein
MFAKWKAGNGTYDLISASGDVTRRLMRSGTLMEVDVSKIPNFKYLYPKFHFPAWNTMNGKRYGVSFTWGPDVLLYDKKTFSSAPQSWAVIYDKRYKGKLSTADNPITIADVALYLGYKDCYNLSAGQLAQVKKTLVAQKSLLRLYWGSSTDLENAFIHHEVVASNAWPLMYNDLGKVHFPVGQTIPREGATGWADTWMLSAHAKHPNCAYMWMRYVTTPQVEAKQALVFGETPVNPKACTYMNKLQKGSCAAYHLNQPLSYYNTIHFWKTPVAQCGWQSSSDCMDYNAWQQAWTQITG